MSKSERLDKILANLGYGSRKDIKGLARAGIVKVNGETIRDSSIKINPYTSKIEIDDEIVEYREFIYLMMNKPKGYISSTDDFRDKTVIDLISDEYKVFNPFPVGRLDKDTEGLMILSNDGQLSHRVLTPKNRIEKLYYAEIEGTVTEEDKLSFQEGIVLDDGYKTLPSKLDILTVGHISKVYVTIEEGKFHQIKRMFLALGKRVAYLKRIAIGGLKLDESLELGEYRELTQEEIILLEKKGL
ncbi:ribosomal small subunit pseudouridine synthase A [Proteiniborus ethanoligenes]|uniref:Pseudouridine synthase n=1 Tax=Proteiniborus ethanoligenes TaxID=415015 RepID=A0A1H3SB86_9FIRM|nr:pseudouridine synthase [Proteiniborus ethanoligenes]SDZ35242.1 ribosomal small subunit pseudouridine synthase A [Proteiniborus ethanoligenes]